MEKIKRYIHKITFLMNIISITATVIIMLIMSMDIILRHTVDITILGAYEIIEYLMLIVIVFCMAHTEVLEEHVKVTMLTEKFPYRIKRIINGIVYLLQSVILFLVMIANIEQAKYIRESNAISPTFRIPAFPFYYCLAAGFGAFAVVILIKGIESFMNISKKEIVNNIEESVVDALF